MIAYATTKHAAVAMVKQMAKDYARDHIRVNALCPGFIDTPFNAGFARQLRGRDQLEAYVAKTIPMGRFGPVAEEADAIPTMASHAARFTTGMHFVTAQRGCL